MRSLKSILGTTLFEEKTQVRMRRYPFADIVAGFLRFLRHACAPGMSGAPCRVVLGRPAFFVDDDPDAVYTYDPSMISDRGALLLRPGKEGRRLEVPATEEDLARAGVPVAARLEAPATAEGGDSLWLDERTFLVGHGYRTNDAGMALPSGAKKLPATSNSPRALARPSSTTPFSPSAAVVLAQKVTSSINARGAPSGKASTAATWS